MSKVTNVMFNISNILVGVIGGGTMGTGIAYAFSATAAEVTLVEPDAERRAVAITRIGELLDGAVARGRITLDRAQAARAALKAVPDVNDLPAGLDLIVEAVPEVPDLKRSVLGAAARRDPHLLGSNTSSISISLLASDLPDPSRLVGTHFFNPVWSMPLVEVVAGRQTAPWAVDAAVEVAWSIGKEPIVVRDAPGFATSRLGVLAGLEAIRMVEEGVASAHDIDRGMELGYGHPMGPLRLTDLVGLDVRLNIAEHLEVAYGAAFRPPRLLREMVAAGHLGKKAGQGFYRWDEPGG